MRNILSKILLIVYLAIIVLACEPEQLPLHESAYPYKEIQFYKKEHWNKAYIPVKYTVCVVPIDADKVWDQKLYPMEFWVDNEDIATITSDGYLTTKKEGIVTVHAKGIGNYGMVEGSITYHVGNILTQLTYEEVMMLIYETRVDFNQDGVISSSELEHIEKLTGEINSDLLFKLADYLPNLKEVFVLADTTSRTLDLSMFKFRKVSIHDRCIYHARAEHFDYEYNLDSGRHLDYRTADYDIYKPYFLTKLILNKEYLEELEIGIMPGFPEMDLSEYENLRLITRIGYTVVKWSDMRLYLPANVEEVNLRDVTFTAKQPCNKLTKITLKNCMPVKLEKSKYPYLKRFDYTWFDLGHYSYITRKTHLDLTDYEKEDFEYFDTCRIFVDVVTLTQTLADNAFKHKVPVTGLKYIIK